MRSRRGFWAVAGAVALSAGQALAAFALDGPDTEADASARGRKPAPATARGPLSAGAERFRADIGFLADDQREGREPGSRGIEASADYIANVFKTAGLKPPPGADGFFQKFTIGGLPTLAEDQELALHGPEGHALTAKFQDDFTPLAIGVGGALKDVPVVFAGYGVTAKSPEKHLDYDDYAGIDARDKVVLVLRHKPREKDEKGPFGGPRATRYSAFQHKAVNAFQHGAKAVLLVNDSTGLHDGEDELLKFLAAGRSAFSNVPFLMVTRKFADQLLAAAGQPALSALEKQIDDELRPRSRALEGWSLSARIGIDRHTITTKNVIGVLEGVGPHAEETVVVGGHYDHLGHGGLFSGSLALLSTAIHNGADDNASGTAMVLELARRLSARRDPLPRRVVFMAFSGEERGLLGSRYYVENPLFPLESTVMMFNCDMVGRLNRKNALTMIGTGTSPGLDELVKVLGKSAGLAIKTVSGMTDGFGGSDHQSFYAKEVPVLFAFTGLHGDYHRPSDDSDKINYAGMDRIADYLELLLLDVARRPERPRFAKSTPRPSPSRDRSPHDASPHDGDASGGPSGMGQVYVGTRPDYAHEEKDGMLIEGTTEGSPAEKAGLKDGDLITRIGDRPVGTIYDYMESLGTHKPGDKVDFTVKRNGKEIKLPVTLGSRKGR